MALAINCHAICRSRVGSPWTTADSACVNTSSTPFALAAGIADAIACRTASSSGAELELRRSLPVSAFETSSRSAVSCACSRAFRSIASSPRCAVAASSRSVRSRCAQPRTALSGVRSSCEIVARNSSFVRLATSLSRLALSASRARASAFRRARRSSSTTPVRMRPWTRNSARCSATAPVSRSLPLVAPRMAPSTVASSAGPVPANHAVAPTAVPSRMNWLPSSINSACGLVDQEDDRDQANSDAETRGGGERAERIGVCRAFHGVRCCDTAAPVASTLAGFGSPGPLPVRASVSRPPLPLRRGRPATSRPAPESTHGSRRAPGRSIRTRAPWSRRDRSPFAWCRG